MKRLKKALALALALAAIICMPVHASAAQESNSYGIDFSKTASVDIYKYDLTSAEKDGVWNSSYVSTVFPLSHKSSVTSPPSLNTGKFRPIRFSGYSDSSFL